MIGIRTLTRPLLAGVFIAGGLEALRNPAPKAPPAEKVVSPLSEQLRKVGLPEDPAQLVKLNAAVQVGGGVLLATGILARPAALALAGSLVPTTLAGHAFWKKNGTERQQQQTQFLKNLAMLGGLLTTALDTGGRPSVFWSSGRAARRAGRAVSERTGHIAGALPTR